MQPENKRQGRKPKSRFYHLRKNKLMISVEIASKILEVSEDDVKRYDDEGAPAMAEKLLMYWDRKYINCEGWNGFLFSRDVLIYKRKRWRPENLIADRDNQNEAEILRQELKALHSWRGIITILNALVRRFPTPHVSRRFNMFQ